MADFNVTECVIENVNGAAFLRPQKSYSIAIAGTSTTSSIPISANTQVVRLATPSSCHFRLGAGATTSDAMIPAGEVVDFSVQPDGGTSYFSVIEASSPTDIGGGGVGDSGLESVNVETLAGNKTITSTDARVQLLNPGGANRNVTLDASLHVEGTLLDIHATGESGYEIDVKNSAATLIARLIYDQSVKVVYASGAWRIINLPYTAEYGTDREHLYVGYRNNVTATHLSIGSGHKAWIDSTGFGVGNSPPSSLFHVTAAGDANALRVDNTTGNIGIGAAPDATSKFTLYHSNTVDGVRPFVVSHTTSVTGNNEYFFLADATNVSYFSHVNNNTGGHACTRTYVRAGSTTGDAVFLAAINGGVNWSMGIDNSDSDSWKLSLGWIGDTNTIVAKTTGEVGIGVSPRSPLHVIGTDLRIATNDTDATNKVGCVVVSNYTNANSPFALVVGTTGTSYNYLALGAQGDGNHTSCTTGFFYAAASSSATGGIVCVGRWTSTGFGVGDAQPSSLFHVTTSGNANALRVDNTTGYLGVGRATVANIQVAIETANGNAGTAWYQAGYASACGLLQVSSSRAYLSLYGSGTEYLRMDPVSDCWLPALSVGKNSARTAGMLLDLDTSNLKQVLGLPSLTTTERDALTGVNRMLIYNSTTDKVQAYAAGAWVDLH